MTVIDKLACSLGRRDEVPNQELAQQILKSRNTKAVKDLVENLAIKDKNIQSDCIKVLYEIGEHQPELIADYDNEFLALLESRNNRLVWGAMTALDHIASVKPKAILKSLRTIEMAADIGSVITKDHFVGILIKLAANKSSADVAMKLLMNQLTISATNQLAMYSERALGVMASDNTDAFIRILTSRLSDVEKQSQRSRIEKVIRKLAKASANSK
ncbi:MAG: hypothetical protein ACREA9_11330 [Pyrinomonadaceae bacterium]